MEKWRAQNWSRRLVRPKLFALLYYFQHSLTAANLIADPPKYMHLKYEFCHKYMEDGESSKECATPAQRAWGDLWVGAALEAGN